MDKTRFLIFAGILFFCLAGYKAEALAVDWEVLGGAELSGEGEDTEYTGVGVIHPVEEDWWILGNVFLLHVSYKYDVDDDSRDGELFSVTPSVGARHAHNLGTFSLSTGLDIEKVSQETEDGGRDEDQKLGVSVQGSWDKWWEGYKNLNLIASYKSIDNFYWSRLRGKKGVVSLGEGFVYLGVETIGMGNDDFYALQVGGVIEGSNIISNLSVALKSGYKHSSSSSDTVYGGLEFYYSF
jgi:hypothetical protein